MQLSDFTGISTLYQLGLQRKEPYQKRQVEKLELSKDSHLWHARNYFLFSFYKMGMNWSDMAHLKISNIVNDRIEYTRLKTKRKTAKAFSFKRSTCQQSL
jgi:hypothetical protein